METWLGVEPRHLAALTALGTEGSFKGAADRLGYVQSAVSQQIAQLERATGTQLVRRLRGHTSTVLTDAGSLLVRHAEGILGHLDAAGADMRALQSSAATLNVGVYESVAAHLLPHTMLRLAQRRPDITIRAHDEQSPREHHDGVRRGTLDIAFEDLPLAPGPFEWCEVLQDPIVLVVPADSPLACRGVLPTLAEVAAVPLIADASWPTFSLIEAQLRAAGLDPQVVLYSDLNTSVQALVAAGLGGALMPRLAVDDSDNRVRVLSLEGLIPPRRIALYWHAHRQRLDGLEAFRDAVLHTCARLQRDVTRDGVAPIASAA